MTGSELREKYDFLFWDSLIVASALIGGEAVLYSKDMHDVLMVEGQLQILNPFK